MRYTIQNVVGSCCCSSWIILRFHIYPGSETRIQKSRSKGGLCHQRSVYETMKKNTNCIQREGKRSTGRTLQQQQKQQK